MECKMEMQIKRVGFTGSMDEKITITTEHAASYYGLPVVLRSGKLADEDANALIASTVIANAMAHLQIRNGGFQMDSGDAAAYDILDAAYDALMGWLDWLDSTESFCTAIQSPARY